MVEFAIDKFLRKKIDLMIKKVTDDDEDDNCLIFEGDTNVGKTNASVGVAHEVAKATGRVFDNSRIFFDTAKAVDFAKKTREQIIIFDEPAFGGLKAEWRKKTQTDLVKLLYTSRIKRHFIIFNLVKFSKFNDDIIEKAIALIRIYKRNETRKERRYLYIPKKRIPALLDFWHRKHIRAYNKFAVAHGTLFRYVLPEIINKEEYNRLKEEMIASIGDEPAKVMKDNAREKELKAKLWEIVDLVHRTTGVKKSVLLEGVKLNERMVQRWNPRENKGFTPILLENEDLKDRLGEVNIYNGLSSKDNVKSTKETIQPIVCSEQQAPYTNSAVPNACGETCQEDIRIPLPG